MRLPTVSEYRTELHVNEETYSVRFVKNIPGEPKSTVGLCDPGQHIIWVRSNLTKNMLARTYIHELLHAIEIEYEIEIPHKVIYQLEKALADTLLANF